MTELLTHVLTGFVLGTVLSFRYDWLDGPFVTVVMVGSILPDLTKVAIVLPSRTVQETLGIPFYWFVLHTPFGTVLTASITALLVGEAYRRRVFGLLLLGGASHFVLDALLINPSRFSFVLLWPFTTRLIPLPMLILSSDRWPAMMAIVCAVVVWLLRRLAVDA
jgi:hypothetical protein